MNPIRNRRSITSPNDAVPEEQDDLVDVLRHAYSSTPVPQDLVAGIQRAVRVSASQPVFATRRPLFGFPKSGLLLAPACAAVVLGLGLSGAFNGSSPKSTAGPSAAAAPIAWTNATGVAVQAQAVYVAPNVIRLTLSSAAPNAMFRQDNSTSKSMPSHAAGNGTLLGTIRDYAGPLSIVPFDYPRSIPVVGAQCPAVSHPSNVIRRQVCFRVQPSHGASGPGYVYLVAPRAQVNEKSRRAPEKASPAPFLRPYYGKGFYAGRSMLPPHRTCPNGELCWVVKIQPLKVDSEQSSDR